MKTSERSSAGWEGSIVTVDGVVQREPRVSVFDRGFLYGDSVFEVFRTYSSLPHALGRHLDRLARSAETIELDLPPRAVVLEDLRHALARAGGDRRVRLVVTRGVGASDLGSYEPTPPTRVVIAQPIIPRPASFYDQGAAIALVEGYASSIRGAKVSNYLPAVVATHRARRAGAHEAVLVTSAGYVLEGATSNVFIVKRGVLLTPPVERILPGITRGIVLELASRLGVETQVRSMTREELLAADEAFITSTTRELMPVVKVDDQKVGKGSPGPVWRRLLEAYRDTMPERLAWPT